MRVSVRLRRRAAALLTAALIPTIPISGIEAAEKRLCVLELNIFGTGGALLCSEPVTPQAVIDTSCQAFEPIRYSLHDTEETKKAIRAHNSAWDALCKDK